MKSLDKKKTYYLSKCCNTEMTIVGDSFGEGTNHYECNECHQPCDFIQLRSSQSLDKKKICLNCGIKMEPKTRYHRERKYCSHTCQQKAAKLRLLDKKKTKKLDWAIELRFNCYANGHLSFPVVVDFIQKLLLQQKKEIEAKWIKFLESEGYHLEEIKNYELQK